MDESSKSGLIKIANEFAAQIFIPHDQDPGIALLRARADPLMQEDETVDKALAKERLRGQKCPYCGAVRKDLSYENVENDGKEVFQGVGCMICEKQFTEVYSFCRVILTDYPGEDFRIDFND